MTKGEKEVKRARSPRKSTSTRPKPARHEDFLTDVSRAKHRQGVDARSRSLGDRIRKARETHGLTLKDISSRTGIDVDRLKRMESGDMTPPLGQLIRLGKALDMKMGYFISPGVDKPMTVVRASQRRPVSRYGEERTDRHRYVYESLAPEKANRMMEPFIVTLLPTDVEEFSSHDGQEFLFVLKGEMKVQVGDQIEFLRSGDAVYYDSNQPHLVESVGSSKTTILAVLYAGPK